jgi:uncharacterized membrane protein YtjA (UPF0391 family)
VDDHEILEERIMYRIAWIFLINAGVAGALCMPGVEVVPAQQAPTLFGVFTTLYLASLPLFSMSSRPIPRL